LRAEREAEEIRRVELARARRAEEERRFAEENEAKRLREEEKRRQEAEFKRVEDERRKNEIIVWQPDEKADECPICNISFGITKRRHHCRGCGRVVCRKCSNHEKVVTKELQGAPDAVNAEIKKGLAVRFCDTCHSRHAIGRF